MMCMIHRAFSCQAATCVRLCGALGTYCVRDMYKIALVNILTSELHRVKRRAASLPCSGKSDVSVENCVLSV